MTEEHRILVGITGASGAVYAERLIEELIQRVPRVYVIFTSAGKQVCDYELCSKKTGFSLKALLAGQIDKKHRDILRVFDDGDLFAPVASGSSAATHMIVVPGSMGTLARIHGGMSTGLLERSADVMLKQKKPLILCPRETPFNTIHLRNMLGLSEMGAHIVPAMPAFYQKPKSIQDMVDFMTGRILELLNLDHTLYKAWNQRMR